MSDLFRIVNFDEEPDGPQQTTSPASAPSQGLANFFRPLPPVDAQQQPVQPAVAPVTPPGMPTTPAVVRSDETFPRPVFLQPVVEFPAASVQSPDGSPTNAQLRALNAEYERRLAARERVEESMREIVFSMGRELCFPAINEAQRQNLSRFESMTIAELARFITKATLQRMSRVLELEARNEQWAIAFPLQLEQMREGDQREAALRQENAALRAALAEKDPNHPLLQSVAPAGTHAPVAGQPQALTQGPLPAPAAVPVTGLATLATPTATPESKTVVAAPVPAVAPPEPVTPPVPFNVAPPVPPPQAPSADKVAKQATAPQKKPGQGAPAVSHPEEDVDEVFDGALAGSEPTAMDREGADLVVRFLASSGEARSTNVRDAIGKLLNAPQKSGQVSRALEAAAVLHYMNKVKVKRDFPQSPRAFLYLTPEGIARAEQLGVKPIPTDLARLAEHYKDGALVAIILAARDILVSEGHTNIRLAPEIRTGTGLAHRPQLAARYNGQEIYIEVIRDLPIQESDDSRWLRAAQIGQGMLHVFAPNQSAQTRVVTAINIARDAHPDHIQRFNAANVKEYFRNVRGKDNSLWTYARF